MDILEFQNHLLAIKVKPEIVKKFVEAYRNSFDIMIQHRMHPITLEDWEDSFLGYQRKGKLVFTDCILKEQHNE